MPQKVILDVDTGYDDAIALLMAGHHPSLQLVGVTVVHGNAPLDGTLDNTLRLIEHGGLSSVPVFAGAERALVEPPRITSEVQRKTVPLPPSSIAVEKQHAVQFLIDTYMSAEGPEIIYAPLGPQTNLALALRIQPQLARRIPQIVTMAGAYIEGNTTTSAEFNVLADPEAAHVVFTSGIPITMVGLEVTSQALIGEAELARLKTFTTPQARIASTIIREEIDWFQARLGYAGAQIFDACAVAEIISPSVVKTIPMRVDIELNGKLTRGRTVAGNSGYRKPEPNTAVGVGIDRDRFIEILMESLG